MKFYDKYNISGKISITFKYIVHGRAQGRVRLFGSSAANICTYKRGSDRRMERIA
jgi:hypothetical protein